MEGFLVSRWQDRWDEGIKQNLQWIKEVLNKTAILVSNIADLNESSHCAQRSCNLKKKKKKKNMLSNNSISERTSLLCSYMF